MTLNLRIIVATAQQPIVLLKVQMYFPTNLSNAIKMTKQHDTMHYVIMPFQHHCLGDWDLLLFFLPQECMCKMCF